MAISGCLVPSVPNNVLIIKPSSLGDVIHGLPVLAKIRATYPDARISWLVGTPAAPLVESNPNLNHIFYFRRNGGTIGTLKSYWRLVRDLKAQKFDCVVDLQGLARSAVIAYMTGAPRRIGFENARERAARVFYNEKVRCDWTGHAVDRCLQVGKALGFDAKEPSFSLTPPVEALGAVERIIAGNNGHGPLPRPYIVLSPGSRWPSKHWPAANMADAAKRMQERFGGTYFITGTADDAEDAKVIAGAIPEAAIDLVGRTSLAETVALISRADLVLTPDSGPMHFADALGTPLVAVFGATDPERTGPYFQRKRVVRAEGVCPKAPCFRRGCSDMKCMDAISGAEVFAKMAAVLEGNA
jgi:heptosyltransferase I